MEISVDKRCLLKLEKIKNKKNRNPVEKKEGLPLGFPKKNLEVTINPVLSSEDHIYMYRFECFSVCLHVPGW